jgi:hypothetical protein
MSERSFGAPSPAPSDKACGPIQDPPELAERLNVLIATMEDLDSRAQAVLVGEQPG